jgi:hypothetical protein
MFSRKMENAVIPSCPARIGPFELNVHVAWTIDATFRES